jgi:hypothetical protein
MKKLAYAVVILAAIALMFAIIAKLTGPIFGIRQAGLFRGINALLLFGINFTLFELLNKK